MQFVLVGGNKENHHSGLDLHLFRVHIDFPQWSGKFRLREIKRQNLLAVRPGGSRTPVGKLQLRRGTQSTAQNSGSLEVAAILGCRLNSIGAQFGSDIGCGQQFVMSATAAPGQCVAGQEFHVRPDTTGTDLRRRSRPLRRFGRSGMPHGGYSGSLGRRYKLRGKNEEEKIGR